MTLTIYQITAFDPNCKVVTATSVSKGLITSGRIDCLPLPLDGDFFVPRSYGLLCDALGPCAAAYMHPVSKRIVGLHFTGKLYAALNGFRSEMPSTEASFTRRMEMLERFSLRIDSFVGLGSTTVTPMLFSVGLYAVTGLLYRLSDLRSQTVNIQDLKALNEDGRTECAKCRGPLKEWAPGRRYCPKCEP